MNRHVNIVKKRNYLLLICTVLFAGIMLSGALGQYKASPKILAQDRTSIVYNKRTTNNNAKNDSNLLDDLNKLYWYYSVDQTKVTKLRKTFEYYNSPLASQSEYFVRRAQELNIDYRLVPAISIVESGGGKTTCNSYNAWGWGGRKCYAFNSWKDAIDTVSSGIKEWYWDLGMTTPEKMANKYNPDTPQEWSSKVRGVMNQIEQQ